MVLRKLVNQGFATDISVNVGQRIDFKIDTDASAYTIDIYRTGYYQGNGARKITSVGPSANLPQNQPNCIADPVTALFDCGNWAVSASWNVPATAVSGVYIAHLKRSNGDTSHITFVVRDDASTSQVVFQTSDTTWQAYNTYGGSSFYTGGANGRAYKLSYNRPFATRNGTTARDFYFANEYPMVRFMEKNGYDVSYIAGVDTDRRGQLLKNHKVFLSVGHDEYWSGAQRANVEAARDFGVNLQFLSGNEMYWRTRYEPSADASHTAYRTLVTYKETWNNAKIDPATEWTGTWRDPRFASKTQGAGRPENALTGTAYVANYADLSLTVGAAEGKLRMWRNTPLANLPAGASQPLAPHTVGYESDEDLDNGSRPAGLIRLSTTTGPTPEYLTDFGNTVVPGTTTHHTTLYKAPSGALVFSAGSVQWTWGLDSEHDSPFAPEPADVRMQQAQVNLLADMGAQPTTLVAPLVAATKSADTVGPTVTHSSPANGSTQPNGSRVTLTGTAADAAGRVAGVEVSTDGATWHPATGTTSWTYSYIQHGQGATAVRVRAIDDSANIGAIAARSFDVPCPCSIFGQEVPAIPAVNDPGPVELGLRFSPRADGYIAAVRFYKGAGNSGTHVGSLWSTSGERLATATFTNETGTGWQTVNFTSPVPVTSGQTYIVSYTAPVGGYAAQSQAFTVQGIDADPFSVAGGFGTEPAGVYGNAGQFPAQSFQRGQYYVDAVFSSTDNSPLTATGQWPQPGSSSAQTGTTIRGTFSKPVVASSVGASVKDALGNSVAGTTSYAAGTRTVTFTPQAALSGFVKYTVTLSASDLQGVAVTDGKTWSFTTARPPNPPGVCPCTLFDDMTLPTMLEVNDPDAVTLGVRFRADVAGTVTGIRFFKGAGNTGTHTGTLWSSGGTQLATGTFSDESTSGWQTLTFTQPVAIAKDTDYVASYRAPVGKYSATPNGLGAAISRPPLRTSSGAGAYTYGSGFPNASSAADYLVDVVFERAAPSIAVASQDPAPGAVSVPRGTTVRVWFTASVAAGAVMTVGRATGSGTTPIAGSLVLSPDATMLKFTPSAMLPPDSDIRVALSGVRSVDGAVLADRTWTFRTRSPEGTANQTMFGDQLPDVDSAADGAPVELGAAFVPAVDGKVTAVRFYKGAGNAGTHTGAVWSAGGQRLATVTFTAETPTGWQTATLSTPLPVTAGTTYVVSYFAPQGHYAHTAGFFAQPWTVGDLTSPASNNGRYLYGAGGGFPVNSSGAANYFVDVTFERAAATIGVAGRNPEPGEVDVARGVSPSVTLTRPVQAGASMTASQGTTSIPGSTSLSPDARTITFDPAAQLPADTEITISLTGVTSTEGAALPATSWFFRTAVPAASGSVSLFTDVVPQTASVNDSAAIELGVAFTPSAAGTVQAIRFYKGAGNTGTHTGSIWDLNGNRLATVAFANETGSGWQTATLTTPLALNAGQTYVVSYYAPDGHYSATPAFFATAWTSGPLSAPSSGNGRYFYGSGGGFPTGSWNSTNYFVDLVFRQTSP